MGSEKESMAEKTKEVHAEQEYAHGLATTHSSTGTAKELHRHTGTQAHRHTGTQVHRYTAQRHTAQLLRYKPTATH